MALLPGYESVGLLALRLAIGSIFLYHGTKKLGNWSNIPGLFKFIGLCETAGGLATIAGFLTQFASIGFSLIMLGAIYHKIYKWHIPFYSEQSTGWELDILILAAALVLIFSGAGHYSIDALAGFWP